MSDPSDRPEPAERTTGRRRFLKRAGALVVAAPLAAVVHAVTSPGEGETATNPRKKSPAPKPAGDPFAAARPDLSICRTAAERATLEQQWKGMLDLAKAVREAPVDPATEPVTIFAALPRRARGKG
jgi:hypothetical protein